MPISRALLNRLRLPYKALDIQGSKGDVLYVPDDVGVDLSVMHGVHNGDMVPVKTDTDGIVSVAVDVGGISNKGKYQLEVFRGITIGTSVTRIVVDTSKTSNYAMYFKVSTTTDPTLTFHIAIESVIRDIVYFALASINMQTSANNIARQILIGNSAASTTDETRLDCQITGGSGSITADIDLVGWN